MENTLTTVQVLRKARDLVQKGWCRGYWTVSNKRVTKYCALGAIRAVVVSIYDDTYFDAEYIFGKIICDPSRRGIIAWNDRQKSKTPVINTFNKAIKLVVAEEKKSVKNN